MINNNSTTTSGFTIYLDQGIKLLIPVPVAEILAAEAKELDYRELRAAEARKIEAEKDQIAKLDKAKKLKRGLDPMPGQVEIFSVEQLELLDENVGHMEMATKQAGIPIYQCLQDHSKRFRAVPNVEPDNVSALVGEFENMAEPIEYLAGELKLMSHLPAHEFSYHSNAVTGKTWHRQNGICQRAGQGARFAVQQNQRSRTLI